MVDAQLFKSGFAIIPQLFTPSKIAALLHCIEGAPAAGANFRRSQDVFAIRNLLGEIPALGALLDTAALRELLGELFPAGCHLTLFWEKTGITPQR